jgi:hypothetical protein
VVTEDGRERHRSVTTDYDHGSIFGSVTTLTIR